MYRYRLLLRVTDGETEAEFTLMGKQAENIINKKADMVFAEARRTGRMVPPSLENIVGKRFMFIVHINITQLHRQRLSYDVNKVEPVPPILSHSPQSHLLPCHIREAHFSTASQSLSCTQKRKTDHTGLSPEAAHLFIRYVIHNIYNNKFSHIYPRIPENIQLNPYVTNYLHFLKLFTPTPAPHRRTPHHLALPPQKEAPAYIEGTKYPHQVISSFVQYHKIVTSPTMNSSANTCPN